MNLGYLSRIDCYFNRRPFYNPPDSETFDLTEYLPHIDQTNEKPSAAVVFLGGPGMTGDNLIMEMEDLYAKPLTIPHIKWLFPEAPAQHYSPFNIVFPMWYDREEEDWSYPEIPKTMERICKSVINLINTELVAKLGIPLNRIVVGGFSTGATVALYTALKYLPGLAGVAALSPFICRDSGLFKLESIPKGIPIFMGHGEKDLKYRTEPLTILKQWKEMGCKELYISVINAEHELNDYVIMCLIEWLSDVMRPSESEKIEHEKKNDNKDEERESKRFKMGESSSTESSEKDIKDEETESKLLKMGESSSTESSEKDIKDEETESKLLKMGESSSTESSEKDIKADDIKA